MCRAMVERGSLFITIDSPFDLLFLLRGQVGQEVKVGGRHLL